MNLFTFSIPISNKISEIRPHMSITVETFDIILTVVDLYSPIIPNEIPEINIPSPNQIYLLFNVIIYFILTLFLFLFFVFVIFYYFLYLFYFTFLFYFFFFIYF